jgi:hypothetical protein
MSRQLGHECVEDRVIAERTIDYRDRESIAGFLISDRHAISRYDFVHRALPCVNSG